VADDEFIIGGEEDADEEELVMAPLELGRVGVPRFTNWRFLQGVTANGWDKQGGQEVPRWLYPKMVVCAPPPGAALQHISYGRFTGEAHQQPTCMRLPDSPGDWSNFDLDFDLDQSFVGGRPAKRARHHDR
jgi:hypothetical protein